MVDNRREMARAISAVVAGDPGHDLASKIAETVTNEWNSGMGDLAYDIARTELLTLAERMAELLISEENHYTLD